jgi:uncharacterized membrane protein YphA (DoxX/SURF4 family)
MNVTLWIGQALLAVLFGLSGVVKSTQSRDRVIAANPTVTKVVPVSFMRLAGVSEVAGALGVVLPWATGVARVLTPVAAAGLALLMLLAAALHTRLREARGVAVTSALLVVAVLVSVGRFVDL